ncbi:hypothetical protein RB653_007161 [Dictyostelium firmibasis]|uniref:VWFA domain-containing protein n=1 Tax=Dictyostelium firmibasis TaxID=79012 RepID=A0AAN7TV73_9MYCE
MLKDIPKIQRQALKTEIKTCSSPISNIIYYSILIETSSTMSPYNLIIKTFVTQLQKTNKSNQIQIITYDDNVNTIFEFESNPNIFKESLKEIKFSKDNQETKLGEALKICCSNIEADWSTDIISKIIIFSSGESTDESGDELVDILSLDNIEIFGLAGGINVEESVKYLQLLLPDQKVIPLSKNLSQDFKKLIGSGYNNNTIGDDAKILPTNCPINIEVYPHSNETSSIKNNLLLDVVIKPDGNASLIPAGTKVTFCSSKYYSGYTINLKDDLVFGEPYEETIILEFKKGQIENFPSKINFTIQIANDKDNLHEGHVALNISYFLGELKSKFRCCIGVEGGIGNGKSTLLNGFVNLFNPTNELEEYFITNRSIGTHVTTSFSNTSLKEILSSKQDIHPLQQSFHDFDIAWCDSWGFTDSDISLKYKADGTLYHGVSKDKCIIQQPLDCYRINCFIFVVSIINFAEINALTKIEKKIMEVIDLGITPLLAITFVDTITINHYQDIMRAKPFNLSVQDSNIFIINNYTEKETHRDITKDVQYLRLLTKAVQLCKIGKEKELMDKLKSLSINNVDSFSKTPIKNQSILDGESSFTNSISASPAQAQKSPHRINVIIDVVPDSKETVFTSFEIEASLDETISELKFRLINEIGSNMNADDWRITKETGTVLLESPKLSSVFKSYEHLDSLKLILKKKVRLF